MPYYEFCELNYKISGEGQPVVLTHGIAASLRDWDALSSTLNLAGFQTISLDLPGHGDSCKPPELSLYHLENVFDTFSEWMRGFGFDRPPILIGHSMGGYITLEYAIRYPEQVRALVLVDPFYSPKQISMLIRMGYRERMLESLAERALPDWFFDALVDATSFLVHGRYMLKHDLPPPIRRQMAENYRKASPWIYNLPFTARDLSPYISHITAPALLIFGTRDQTLNPQSFEYLSKALKNVKTIPFKAGHLPHQSHESEFNAVVLEFLETINQDNS